MLMTSQSLRGLFQVSGAWLPAQPSPESAARVMTCGFSMLQHIGAGARVNMWYPRRTMNGIAPLLARIEWLAIRQVEVLHEGCHIELFDMEMENFKRSLKFFNVARARSQRLVVIIGGTYKNPRANQDHLTRFDHRFRARLQSMINMLWLDEMNAVTSRVTGKAGADDDWDIMRMLPNVGATFGAKEIFNPVAIQKSQQAEHFAQAADFLDEIKHMPRNSAREHSIFVGLKIPKHQDDNDIDWGPAPEFQRLPFIQALQSIFNAFDMDTPTTHHPRGHGDHMNFRKRHNYTTRLEAGHAA